MIKTILLSCSSLLANHGLITLSRPLKLHTNVLLSVIPMDLRQNWALEWQANDSLNKNKKALPVTITSISFPRSNLGALRILTFRMKTFCNGKMLEVAFSISLPMTSGINLETNSFRSQVEAWLAMISTILRRICKQ